MFSTKEWVENFDLIGLYMRCNNCYNSTSFDINSENLSSFILYVNTDSTPKYLDDISNERLLELMEKAVENEHEVKEESLV